MSDDLVAGTGRAGDAGGWPGPGRSPIETRLQAEETAIQRAVLETVPAAPGREPEHRHLTEALVTVVLDRFEALVRTGPSGASADHDALREIGVRYAGYRVSQAQALYEFDRTVIEVSRRSWMVAGPSDAGVLLHLAQMVENDVALSRAALSEGYVTVFAAFGTRAASRRQLAECLLVGRPVSRHLLLAANVTTADHYLVLCADEPEGGCSPEDVGRTICIPGVLVRCHEEHVWVLVPAPRLSVKAPAELAGRGFGRLAVATGVIVAGAAVSDVAGIPDAAEETLATLEIASSCAYRGAVLTDDVVIERALAGSRSPAVGQLAQVIAGLGQSPHLVETLRVLYGYDLDRSRAAAALHIARRTLTNRLDRIQQLTGIHPTSARGVQTLMTALAAERLIRLPAARRRPEREAESERHDRE
jgi:PucR C-terminal helix-turn-helix domain